MGKSCASRWQAPCQCTATQRRHQRRPPGAKQANYDLDKYPTPPDPDGIHNFSSHSLSLSLLCFLTECGDAKTSRLFQMRVSGIIINTFEINANLKIIIQPIIGNEMATQPHSLAT